MYLIKRNGNMVKQVVMSGEIGYKKYLTPDVILLSFETKDAAIEVANILGNCEVVSA